MKATWKIALQGGMSAHCPGSAPSAFGMDNDKPGKGKTVSPARATWDTGFFQEAIVSQGLEELGYKVKPAKDLANPIAYKSITLGDIQYWTNGWYPNHISQCPKDFR